jgi:TonB family protein
MSKRILYLLLLASLSNHVAAQERKEIASHLQKKFKLSCLRVPFFGKQLEYGNDGVVIGHPDPASTTNGGMLEINKLEIKDKEVEIRATRVVLINQPFEVVRTSQQSRLILKLNNEISETDFASLLSKVLEDQAEIDAAVAGYWRPYPIDSTAPKDKLQIAGVLQGSRSVYRFSTDKRFTPPKPVYSPDPEYDEESRRKRISGIVVLKVVLNESGCPEIIEVQRTLVWLDRQAVDAVSQWKFQPSKLDGKPVPVLINIEVSFNL